MKGKLWIQLVQHQVGFRIPYSFLLQKFKHTWYVISYKQPSLPPINIRPFEFDLTHNIDTPSVGKTKTGSGTSCISSNSAVPSCLLFENVTPEIKIKVLKRVFIQIS